MEVVENLWLINIKCIFSFPSQHNPTSSSESEGSRSNLQTTVEQAAVSFAPWTQASAQLQSPRVNPVQQWVESTTKEASVTVKG